MVLRDEEITREREEGEKEEQVGGVRGRGVPLLHPKSRSPKGDPAGRVSLQFQAEAWMGSGLSFPHELLSPLEYN